MPAQGVWHRLSVTIGLGSKYIHTHTNHLLPRGIAPNATWFPFKNHQGPDPKRVKMSSGERPIGTAKVSRGGGGGCKSISRQIVVPSTDASKQNTNEATFASMLCQGDSCNTDVIGGPKERYRIA